MDHDGDVRLQGVNWLVLWSGSVRIDNERIGRKKAISKSSERNGSILFNLNYKLLNNNDSQLITTSLEVDLFTNRCLHLNKSKNVEFTMISEYDWIQQGERLRLGFIEYSKATACTEWWAACTDWMAACTDRVDACTDWTAACTDRVDECRWDIMRREHESWTWVVNMSREDETWYSKSDPQRAFLC